MAPEDQPDWATENYYQFTLLGRLSQGCASGIRKLKQPVTLGVLSLLALFLGYGAFSLLAEDRVAVVQVETSKLSGEPSPLEAAQAAAQEAARQVVEQFLAAGSAEQRKRFLRDGDAHERIENFDTEIAAFQASKIVPLGLISWRSGRVSAGFLLRSDDLDGDVNGDVNGGLNRDCYLELLSQDNGGKWHVNWPLFEQSLSQSFKSFANLANHRRADTAGSFFVNIRRKHTSVLEESGFDAGEMGIYEISGVEEEGRFYEAFVRRGSKLYETLAADVPWAEMKRAKLDVGWAHAAAAGQDAIMVIEEFHGLEWGAGLEAAPDVPSADDANLHGLTEVGKL